MMYELIVSCVSASAICFAFIDTPRPDYKRMHDNHEMCLVEMKRLIEVWNSDGVMYKLTCERSIYVRAELSR
jgi:hypothetical protein